MKNDLYDSLATECGEAVNETVKTVTGNEVMQELKKVDKTVNDYAQVTGDFKTGDVISVTALVALMAAAAACVAFAARKVRG